MGCSLAVKSLGVEIEHRDIFSALSFNVGSGRLCQLRGPNGSGKSTLLLVLAGLFDGFSGQVIWYDDQGQALSPASSKLNMRFVSTRIGLTPELTVAENLSWLAALDGVLINNKQLPSIMDQVGLSCRLLTRPLCALSSGQQQRIKLAGLFLCPKPIWLLDEPFTALDVDAVLWVEQAMDQHTAQGGMVIYASHHQSRKLVPEVSVALG